MMKVFKRKFVLRLTQYQDYRTAISKTGSAPVANIARNSAASVVPKRTTTQQHKSSLDKIYPPGLAEEVSDTDSEPILPRKVMTRHRNVSVLAGRDLMDEELDGTRRRRSSRIRTEVTAAVESMDGAPSLSSQSPSSRNMFAAKPPNDSDGGKNGDHVPTNGSPTLRSLLSRKRTLSKLSLETAMSAKRPTPRSTVREQIWPSNIARSADSDVEVSRKEAEKDTDDGIAELSADGQPQRARSHLRACQRCQRARAKCDVDKPCRKCRISGYGNTSQAPFYYSVKTFSVVVLTISRRLYPARARSHPKPTFPIHRAASPILSR